MSLQGIAYDDRLYFNHISRKARNAEIVEMKIWAQDACFENKEPKMPHKLRDPTRVWNVILRT